MRRFHWRPAPRPFASACVVVCLFSLGCRRTEFHREPCADAGSRARDAMGATDAGSPEGTERGTDSAAFEDAHRPPDAAGATDAAASESGATGANDECRYCTVVCPCPRET